MADLRRRRQGEAAPGTVAEAPSVPPGPSETPPGRAADDIGDITWKDYVVPILLLFCLPVGCVYLFMTMAPKPPAVEVQRLDAPKLWPLEQFKGEYRDRMLWGTYRPGCYLGLRMRFPKTVLAGLMWFDPDDPDALSNIRHLAQERDGLDKYGWERHDGEQFGRQELYDGDYHITTSFAKRFFDGHRGGDWAVRVAAEQRPKRRKEGEEGGESGDDARPRRISLVFYAADDDARGGAWFASNSPLKVLPEGPANSSKVVLVKGSSFPIDTWQLHLFDPSGGKQLEKLRYMGAVVHDFHNLTELLAGQLAPIGALTGRARATPFRLRNTVQELPNVAAFQLTLDLPLSVDLVFTASIPSDHDAFRDNVRRQLWDKLNEIYLSVFPNEPPPLVDDDVTETPEERLAALSGDALTTLLEERESAFDKRFKATFGPMDAPDLPPGTGEVAKAALSNLLGGIGFFYGKSLAALPPLRPGGPERMLDMWETGLFTAVPSRSFFPRGFLWDEGFHQLLVSRWNPKMSRDILGHWLDLMTGEGWIPREQILGEEARARVPAEFVAQRPNRANPPTLFLPLADLARRVAASSPTTWWQEQQLREELTFLSSAYVRLQAWVEWFQDTQAGQVTGSWRWRGRDATTQRELNPKTLTSGLDDFPRASHPSDEERHVDLHCWMALAARAIATIGAALQLPFEKVKLYEGMANKLAEPAHLNSLHWDAAAKQFRDWGNHTEDVALQWMTWRNEQGVPVHRELLRQVTGKNPIPQFVPQFGYVSLFPLMMRIITADSEQLESQLTALREERLLWTPYGLRSLAASSSLHNAFNTEHEKPYWRGPIWPNINYLVLAALKHYSLVEGPHAKRAGELHDELKAAFLGNLVKQYQASGYLWENYDENTGEGRGSHPFTGWTSLLVLIASETYVEL